MTATLRELRPLLEDVRRLAGETLGAVRPATPAWAAAMLERDTAVVMATARHAPAKAAWAACGYTFPIFEAIEPDRGFRCGSS